MIAGVLHGLTDAERAEMRREMAKATKPHAHYVVPAPTADQCDGCTMFRAPDRCTAVAGRVSPGGWCRFFEARHANA